MLGGGESGGHEVECAVEEEKVKGSLSALPDSTLQKLSEQTVADNNDEDKYSALTMQQNLSAAAKDKIDANNAGAVQEAMEKMMDVEQREEVHEEKKPASTLQLLVSESVEDRDVAAKKMAAHAEALQKELDIAIKELLYYQTQVRLVWQGMTRLLDLHDTVLQTECYHSIQSIDYFCFLLCKLAYTYTIRTLPSNHSRPDLI